MNLGKNNKLVKENSNILAKRTRKACYTCGDYKEGTNAMWLKDTLNLENQQCWDRNLS